MTKKSGTTRVKFAFMAIGFDTATEQEHFSFDVNGHASAHAIIRLPAGPDKGDRNHVAIMQHKLEGQFNVLACSVRGKSINYSFTHIEDRLQLGEHLKSLGVADKLIATWNEMKPDHTVPVKTAAVDHEAADVIAKAMGGKPAKGTQNKPE